MELGQDFLFFFAALGAFNALLLSAYLLAKSRKPPHSYFFLGLLLLELAVRAGFSCLYYFDDAPRELIKLGLAAHLLIGPTLYYLILGYLKPTENRARAASLHLLILVVLLVAFGALFSFEVWDYTIRYSIHGLLTAYLLLCGVILLPAFKELHKQKSEKSLNETKARSAYLAVLLICLGFVISLYTNYILGPLSFSVLLYAFVYHFFRLERRSQKISSYKTKLDTAEVSRVEARLTELMQEEKPYRDPELTLEKLSKMLAVSKYFLSQMLNDNLNTSYHELITEYRIMDACELLQNAEHYTLEAIAYEVGFNSKSSFFSAFKRLKGSTPAKFRAQIKV